MIFRQRVYAVVGLFATLLLGCSCKKSPVSAAAAPEKPTLRVHVISTLAGALEPCGCVEDMLGGVDHAAALLSGADAPDRLAVAAGPLLFMDPELHPDRRTQDLWKAETIASALRHMGVVAWAPGFNDWAAGQPVLNGLRQRSGADLLAANFESPSAGSRPFRVVTAGGLRVGITAVSEPSHDGKLPDGVSVLDREPALRAALAGLKAERAQVLIVLLSLQRGEALRLLEAVSGFHLAVVGKPVDQGESNDPPVPATLIGATLVVQMPNHLQSIGVVDLFVRDQDLSFEDGGGLGRAEQRRSLELRVSELEKRIETWKKNGAEKRDIDARQRDVEAMQTKLRALAKTPAPPKGSFFRYESREVVERAGSDPTVASAMLGYYKRVNEHNQRVFSDRKPPPVPDGKSGYAGVDLCASCHQAARRFWDGTKHAIAYETLEKGHKQFNLECVSCHVTGYDRPGGSTVTHVQDLKDVQCETCHGPGSAHIADPQDPALIIDKPDASQCAPLCHHPPHVKPDWDVSLAWAKIVGPGHGQPAPEE